MPYGTSVHSYTMTKVKHAAANGPLQRQLKWTICNSSSKVACSSTTNASHYAYYSSRQGESNRLVLVRQSDLGCLENGQLVSAKCLLLGKAACFSAIA